MPLSALKDSPLQAEPAPRDAGAAPRVLLVDDQRTVRTIVKGALGQMQAQVLEAATAEQALAAIRERAPDLVVLDLLLPDMQGLDVLRRIRRDFSDLNLPVIILSVNTESDAVVEALAQGANDYVTKPINVPVFTARVKTQLSRKRAYDEITKLKDALQEQIGHLTREVARDPVTGLMNRRQFELRLQRLLGRARDAATGEHALVYLDLDQFKVVNNACGHTGGDRVLRRIANALRTRIRGDDILARLGGDEFAILLEGCPLDHAVRIAYELQDVLKQMRFDVGEHHFSLHASIAVVPVHGSSGTVAEVLRRTDSACYLAKEKGRNRVYVFREDDDALAQRDGELQTVVCIHDALMDDRFCFAYQPIVPIGDFGEPDTLRYELLLRLNDANNNPISPGVLLPTAERYQLATKIDRWVVQAAFDMLGARPDVATHLGLCSINLSGQSLADEEFLRFVLDAHPKLPVSPGRICFEITETAAVDNLEEAHEFITTLKNVGFRFALDDFGAGMASFGYLKRLPIDFLKIDGMFIRDILDDEVSETMVRSINEIGHAMGKRTIAEFVENDAVLEKVREIGVDFAQGYGIGRPAPIEQLYERAASLEGQEGDER